MTGCCDCLGFGVMSLNPKALYNVTCTSHVAGLFWQETNRQMFGRPRANVVGYF